MVVGKYLVFGYLYPYELQSILSIVGPCYKDGHRFYIGVICRPVPNSSIGSMSF